MKLVSEYKQKVLHLLLQDPRISGIVLTNGEIPKSVEVHDDGSVTFGRTPRHWWNWIWGDKKTIEFRELSLLMLTAYSKYLPPGSGLEEILTKEVIENAYKNNNYEDIIDRFTLYAFLGVTEGEFMIDKLKLTNEDPRQQSKMREDKKKNKSTTMLGVGYLDLGGGQIPIGIRIDPD